MKRLLILIGLLTLAAGCASDADTEKEQPKRFDIVYRQMYPKVYVLWDSPSGTCWVTTESVGTALTQAPKEVCEVTTP